MDDYGLWILLGTLAVGAAAALVFAGRRRRRRRAERAAPPAAPLAALDEQWQPTDTAAWLESERDAAAAAARVEAQRQAAEAAAGVAAGLEAERQAAAQAAAQAARLQAERRAADDLAQLQAIHRAAEHTARLRAEQEARRRAAEHAARLRGEQEAAALLSAQQLAAAEAAAHALAVAAAPAPAAAAPRRTPEQTLVLVADDSKVVRVKTSRLLAQHRYRVVLAEDGLDAMRKIETEAPQVLITDVEMPGMDGFELTRHVRSQARTAHIPIIMITSADDRLRAAAAEAGVTVLLGKPYPEDELIARIEQAQQAAAALTAGELAAG